MFSAKLYTFSKKPNSTKRPSDSGTDVNIVLKAPTSVLNPILELDFGNNNPTVYNYCYIATFNRYYFIEDWTYNGRLWEATCNFDALASWKTDIGNSNLYVLRSRLSYDNNIVDTIYPSKVTVSETPLKILDFPFAGSEGGGDIDFSLGRFILGVNGTPNQSGGSFIANTGITYYVMTDVNLSYVRESLFPTLGQVNTADTINNMAGITICNPTQYISSLMWFPFDPTSSYGNTIYTGTLTFGFWQTDVRPHFGILQNLTWKTSRILIPELPVENSARGKWALQEPYCSYNVYIPFFGKFNLPSDLVANGYHFRCDITVSLTTGQGTLKVYPIPSQGVSKNVPCIILTAQVGVPMIMGGVGSDLAGIAKTIGTIGMGFGKVIAGDPMGLLDVAKGGITTALLSSMGKGEVMGTSGGATEDNSRGYYFTRYAQPIDEDIEHNGRPLCQMKTINTLSGFIQVGDGDVSIACTQQERDQIKSYLEGGFFYE